MRTSLLHTLTGALLVGLVGAGLLAPAATAQSLTAETVSQWTAADASMASHPYTPVANLGAPIYDNGNLNTGTVTESGVTVPTAGYEWSEVQHDVGNTTESNTSAGSTCTATTTTSFRLADDFTVPAGETWTITDVTTYAYQTGFAGAGSPVGGANLQIWDGPPNDVSSSIIFGDATTNRLTASVEANLYRIFNTAVPPPGSAPGTTRRIYANTIAVSPALVVGPGTYWLDYQHILAAGTTMFCPTVTVVGSRGLPGWNALQWTGTAWVAALDTGNPASAPDVPQDFPFELGGSISGGGGVQTYDCSDCPRAIPDFTTVPGVTTSTLVVPAGAPDPIIDLNVRVQFAHTWAGDLIATLAKGATSVTFFDRPGRTTTGFGCTGDDPTFIADDEGSLGPLETSCVSPPGGVGPAYTVDGRYTPNAPLSAFDTQSAVGTWTLTVSDNAGGDTGSLVSWTLIVTPLGVGNEGGPQDAALSLRVAPNPIASQGQVELSVAATTEEVRVALYDLLGREVREVFSGAMTAGQVAYIAFRTDGLPAGTYILRATGDGIQTTQRVTITR